MTTTPAMPELPEPSGVIVVGTQALRAFTADQMDARYLRGYNDALATLQAQPAPNEHIKEPYTLAELNERIASNDYNAELLLQHAMLLLNTQPEEVSDADVDRAAQIMANDRGYGWPHIPESWKEEFRETARAILALRPQAESEAPTVEAARAMGATGGPVVEAERLAFEAWMAGHCWAVSPTWNGETYDDSEEDKKRKLLDPLARTTRMLWAAWRDRAALSSLRPQAVTHEDWPLRAKVWRRDSTSEWVLEISGTLCDTYMHCRHTQPLSVQFEDVPGLPTLYEDAQAVPMTDEQAVLEDEEFSLLSQTQVAALLWVLWCHQGASSPVGQPIRFALGMDKRQAMSDEQVSAAQRFRIDWHQWSGITAPAGGEG